MIFSGKPARLEDADHPDWAPTQNLGHSKVTRKSEVWHRRQQRIQERNNKKVEVSASLFEPLSPTIDKGMFPHYPKKKLTFLPFYIR